MKLAWLVAASLVTLAGCGGQPHNGSAVTDPSIAQYGYGPALDNAIVYQPDVVIVAGGARAIRAASANGLTWTIDGSAAGAAEIQPGKVMFVTSQVVGRVVRVERAAADLSVTLAPVQLTEVIRNGRITVDQTIDLEAASFHAGPDLLGVVTLASHETPAVVPPLLGFVRGITAAAMPVVHAAGIPDGEIKGSVGDWDLTASKNAQQIRLRGDHKLEHGKGLKVGLDLRLAVSNLRLQADVPVVEGVVGQSKFEIDGIRGIGVTISAGASEGLSDNRKARIEWPVEIREPIVIGGLPTTLKQKFKFLVETAFSAKNGNLSATGQWGLDGPLGFDGKSLTTPTFSVEQSILDSLSSVSVGANGIVVAVEFGFSLEIGLPVAGAGPYTGLVASVGLTSGSSAGLVHCQGATLVLSVKGGVGLNVSPYLVAVLENALSVKVPGQTELFRKDIVSVSQTRPQVALCGG